MLNFIQMGIRYLQVEHEDYQVQSGMQTNNFELRKNYQIRFKYSLSMLFMVFLPIMFNYLGKTKLKVYQKGGLLRD